MNEKDEVADKIHINPYLTKDEFARVEQIFKIYISQSIADLLMDHLDILELISGKYKTSKLD